MRRRGQDVVQQSLGIHLPDTASFEAFHPGPNAEALAAVRALAAGGTGSHFLWGLAGSGKTHLLQAACREASISGEPSAYLPLHDLADEPPLILEGLAEGRLLCLDDLDAIAGRRDWELALVSHIDRLRHTGGRLLCSAPSAPEGLDLLLPDLESRLSWGSIHRLRLLDDDERLEALRLRAAQRGLKLPIPVAAYLLARAPRNMPALMDLLERLDRASMVAKRRLTVPFVREVLYGEQTD